MAWRVLITGVGGGLGAQIARRLDEGLSLPIAGPGPGAEDGRPAMALFGLDHARSRRRWRRLKFIRADLRQLSSVDAVRAVLPDVVLHFAVSLGSTAALPRFAHETNVVGTMNLLAACRGATRIVAESSTAIYPTSADMPSVLREEDAAGRPARSRTAADLREMEAMIAEQGVVNPALELTVLRYANILGPRWQGGLARHLRLPAPPAVVGYDPRLQLLAVEDAVEAACRAATAPHAGTFNVAGEGSLLLSQLLRLGGRAARPVLPPLVGSYVQRQAYRLLTRRLPSPHLVELLQAGQVVDTGALRREFGWGPRLTTREVAAATFGSLPHPAAELATSRGRAAVKTG